MRMRSAKLLALLSFTTILTACGQNAAERAIEPAIEEDAGDTQVDIQNDGAMHVETDEGTAMIGGGNLPDGWPEDIEVYAGAELAYSASINPQTGEPGMAIVMMTEDDVAAVSAYYKQALSSGGWTTGDAMEGGGTSILTATKGNQVASFMITEADGQTAITIGINEAEQE